MPFLSSLPANRPYAAQLQSISMQVFISKSHIEFIDRSTDALVLKELENQTREQSISSATLVEQGKLSGAQEIIVGTLTTLGVELKGSMGLSDRKYGASINFSLQVVDAATGKMKSTRNFNGSTKMKDAGAKALGEFKKILGKAAAIFMADTKEEAIGKAMEATKQEIADWIQEAYPPVIMLMSIESRDKKGFPQTVMVSGEGLSSGKKITIKEISFITDATGTLRRREVKVGELKVSEDQGEVFICKVTDGENTLEEKMKSGAQLEFIVK